MSDSPKKPTPVTDEQLYQSAHYAKKNPGWATDDFHALCTPDVVLGLLKRLGYRWSA